LFQMPTTKLQLHPKEALKWSSKQWNSIPNMLVFNRRQQGLWKFLHTMVSFWSICSFSRVSSALFHTAANKQQIEKLGFKLWTDWMRRNDLLYFSLSSNQKQWKLLCLFVDLNSEVISSLSSIWHVIVDHFWVESASLYLWEPEMRAASLPLGFLFCRPTLVNLVRFHQVKRWFHSTLSSDFSRNHKLSSAMKESVLVL
jgi:hypothetical protein